MRCLALILACMGCATTRGPVTPMPELADARRPELRTLPPTPREEVLPGEFHGEEWVLPIEQGEAASKPGLLVSESRMARDILFRTRYDELRTLYVEDRKVWTAHRDYYEQRLVQAKATIDGLQPNWWDEHKDYVYLSVIGILAGYSLTLLVQP